MSRASRDKSSTSTTSNWPLGHRGFRVLEDHLYAEQAQSGARRDRQGLSALVGAAQPLGVDGVRAMRSDDRPGERNLYAHIPETVRTKQAELGAEERRLANFVDFIGEGRGSQALAKALVETERRVEALREELEGLRRSREKVFQTVAASVAGSGGALGRPGGACRAHLRVWHS